MSRKALTVGELVKKLLELDQNAYPVLEGFDHSYDIIRGVSANIAEMTNSGLYEPESDEVDTSKLVNVVVFV